LLIVSSEISGIRSVVDNDATNESNSETVSTSSGVELRTSD